jgi:SAM-dependent methyltransferase
MINWLFSRIQRPERGWDPVPAAHAQHYGGGEWESLNEVVLDQLEDWVGGLAGKRVLDLGGGPGQYTAAFALRGAQVTWFDVSRNYQAMAQAKAAELRVADRVDFCLGYMDDAPRLLAEPFDLVFNRICWNYGRSDRGFADVMYRLVRPGGIGYIDTTNAFFNAERLSAPARLRTWLNAACSIKIGHPYPPRGRVANLLLGQPVARLLVDYTSAVSDRVLFEKPAAIQ